MVKVDFSVATISPAQGAKERRNAREYGPMLERSWWKSRQKLRASPKSSIRGRNRERRACVKEGKSSFPADGNALRRVVSVDEGEVVL